MKLYERARTAQEEGKVDEAARLLGDAVSSDENNIYAWMSLGEAELRRERYFASAAAFHRAARLAPSRYEPRYNLGCVLESAGRYADAIREYEAALRLSPGQVEVMENLARTYVSARLNEARARELVEKSLAVEDRPEWRQWLELYLLRNPGRTRTANADPGAPASAPRPEPATRLSEPVAPADQ